MTAAELNRRLAEQGVVSIPADEWARLEGAFEVLERHATGVAGDLLIVRDEAGLAAVEQPTPDERVVRRVSDDAEARRFVAQRIEEYERMWDGCGCKIDYYS